MTQCSDSSIGLTAAMTLFCFSLILYVRYNYKLVTVIG